MQVGDKFFMIAGYQDDNNKKGYCHMNFKPLLEAIQKTVYGYGAKAVAARLGHSVQYLGKICNPEPEPEEKRLISLEAFVAILDETKDDTGLAILANMRGYRLVPMTNPHPVSPTMFEEFNEDHIALVAFHETATEYRKGKATQAELIKTRDAAHLDIDQSYERTVDGDVDGQIMREGKWVNVVEQRQ